MTFLRLLPAALLFLLGLCLSAPCRAEFPDSPAPRPEIIAHRCYNAAERAPENSPEALRAALRRDYLYGVEMDVWVTADDVVVVYHDESINGLSLERSRYEELREHKLANGEPLPTLASFFALLREKPAIRAVIEIKQHASAENGLRAADAVVRLVREYGLERQVEYQSFDPAICERIIRSDVAALVGYPRGDMPPAELRARGFRIMDDHYGVAFAAPSRIRDAQQRGLRANVYTTNSWADMLHAANLGVDCICTDFPEDLRALLAWRENSVLRPLLMNAQLTMALSALRNTPLAIVYALQESCGGVAAVCRVLPGGAFLSLPQFCSILSGLLLLTAFAAVACRRGVKREPRECRRRQSLLLSFCSRRGRVSPLAFWWRQLLLIIPLYLGTYGACLAGKQGLLFGLSDDVAVLSVLLSQLCPTSLLASAVACVEVHYAGAAAPWGLALGSVPASLLALFCLALSLFAAWCSFSLVLRRLRDSRPGLWTLPLCLSLLWAQFIMLTAQRPVWLDDALVLLVLLIPAICTSLPSRRRLP